ncbi:uncharacterized protein LOC121232505 isoform X2 [Aquila chrysaetos chrysaetos]|uniref:uncharacterized protein LOC121232505 isoform X2 n=1 Tax=Aquila chrysaetos chrysaetos TaxID=223781 RepID=UPI001B7D3BBE|nr:uncharacterized protein LOC121232505 isoform X2 [Aquila chrysaetos chrysaetos]
MREGGLRERPAGGGRGATRRSRMPLARPLHGGGSPVSPGPHGRHRPRRGLAGRFGDTAGRRRRGWWGGGRPRCPSVSTGERRSVTGSPRTRSDFPPPPPKAWMATDGFYGKKALTRRTGRVTVCQCRSSDPKPGSSSRVQIGSPRGISFERPPRAQRRAGAMDLLLTQTSFAAPASRQDNRRKGPCGHSCCQNMKQSSWVSVTCQTKKMEQPIHSTPDKYTRSPLHPEHLVEDVHSGVSSHARTRLTPWRKVLLQCTVFHKR